jgi:hypothetical protein
MQKKQKVKDNPIAPAIPPSRRNVSNKSSVFSIIQGHIGSSIKMLTISQNLLEARDGKLFYLLTTDTLWRDWPGNSDHHDQSANPQK